MIKEELIALASLIADPLTATKFRDGLDQLDLMRVEIFGADKANAYGALGRP